MRHNNKKNHLGRKEAHRKAMLSNMACSLIKHKRIFTTTAKAKALKIYVEPLLTKSKEDTTHSRRVVFSYLQDKDAVSILFREIAEKIANRPGGYTRILKTGFRSGDNAQMCFIELVDYNENMLKEKETKKSSRTRRSGGAKKKVEAASAEEVTVVEQSEEVSVAEKEVAAKKASETKPKATKAPKEKEVESSNEVIDTPSAE